jgi:exosortase B
MLPAALNSASVRALPAALILLLGGWAALYLPVYWHAFETIWQTDDQGHGPLIVGVCIWLFWQIRQPLNVLPWQTHHWLGWPLFVAGLLLYLLGRTFAFQVFTFGSQIPIAAGLLLLTRGTRGLRVGWFAVLFLLFMTPLPGTFVDATTQSLKQWISFTVAEILHALGYPISRTGVTISVGQYQLLVADACSGMNSMFSLSALGTLYIYLMNRRSHLHNALMLLIILPTAFFANMVRVVILVLITYYFGEEAGRGFLHGFAGMALLAVSLLILFSVDAALTRLIRPHSRDHASVGLA